MGDRMDKQVLETLSFEESYDRLEQVIQQLEKGDLSLEQSVALYEEGVQLAEYCGHKLDDAELKVSQLLNAATESARDADDILF
ncbi:MAG: exodeoxyribonuclease VII small subunit [Chloroflexi bacterium]|nr:exodeoxyribonuclease VII small subunit [Chloroflexota bacterium]